VLDFIWNDLLINPMLNGLIVLSRLLFDNFGLAVIVFTIIVRAATTPLMLRQINATKRMQSLQPKMDELRKKYSDPKRRSEETMKLYRQEGVNPIGCLGPMLIQMPIWFALYAVLTNTVGGTPERIVELSQRLYPWEFIQKAVPLPTGFLWLDLGRPDMILVFLVGITTWLQTKLSMTQASMSNPQTAQTNNMMLWLMPLMFAWFTITVPSGLALYWTVTNIIGIVMNYFVYGWRERPFMDIFAPLNKPPDGSPRKPRAAGSAAPAADRGDATPGAPSTDHPSAPDDGDGMRQRDAQSGNKRQERRGSGRQGASAARSRSVSGRRRNR
jgi:YidC/Oxa1 family membrane protein insertase